MKTVVKALHGDDGKPFVHSTEMTRDHSFDAFATGSYDMAYLEVDDTVD